MRPTRSRRLVLTIVPVAAAILLASIWLGDSGQVAFSDLRAGTCFNDGRLDEVTDTVAAIPCDRPHLHEAFAVVTLPDGPDAAYPGADPLRRRLIRACTEPFERFVGAPLPRTTYGLFPVAPMTRASWDEGNRKAVCALFDLSLLPRRGSARGTGSLRA